MYMLFKSKMQEINWTYFFLNKIEEEFYNKTLKAHFKVGDNVW